MGDKNMVDVTCINFPHLSSYISENQSKMLQELSCSIITWFASSKCFSHQIVQRFFTSSAKTFFDVSMISCLILRIAFSSVSIFFWLLFMEERQGLIVSPYSVSINFNACFFVSFFTNGMNVKGTKSWAGALFLVVLLVWSEKKCHCHVHKVSSKTSC